MIIGIGTDLCEIRRMEDKLDKEAFLSRVFTEAELRYVRERGKGAASSLAACYAAKEAAAKALGTGFRGFGPREIEVTHDEWGCPALRLHGEAARIAAEKRIRAWKLSLSHDGGLAAAFAIAEAEDKE